MKKLNRKLLFLLLTAFLLANATVVYAYTMQHTQDLVNTFLPAYVDSEVVEKFDGEEKSEIKIKNTSNVEAYLRMKIITYWQDSKGNIVAIPPKTLTIVHDPDHWFLQDGYYYYKHPVPAGDVTFYDLLDGNTTISLETYTPDNDDENDDENDGEDNDDVTYTYYPVVEIVSEAFQSKPAHAVQSNWGVTVGPNRDISEKQTT